MSEQNSYTAFEGHSLLCQGDLSSVVLKAKRRLDKGSQKPLLIFSDSTGKSMDFNFQGSETEVLKRLEVYTAEVPKENSAGPGRPKLGVISREVSLLPKHWEWLASQSGGASATLRKIVEDLMKKESAGPTLKQQQERVYRVMSVLAGDLPNYEQALRVLYRKDGKEFGKIVSDWPKDIASHLNTLAEQIFE
jgi:hypothetical protein